MVGTNDGRAAAIYRQIVLDIERAIASGEYKPGERLPSEAHLMKRYGASTTPVRRAYETLINMGLVVARVGKGHYVRETLSAEDTGPLVHFLLKHIHELEIVAPPLARAFRAAVELNSTVAQGARAPKGEADAIDTLRALSIAFEGHPEYEPKWKP